MSVALMIDISILLALAVTIFYAARLSTYLKTFYDGRKDMDFLIRDLSSSVARADNAIGDMRSAADETIIDLNRKVETAKKLSDELGFMNEAGDSLANRLEKLAERNRELVDLLEQVGGVGHPKTLVATEESMQTKEKKTQQDQAFQDKKKSKDKLRARQFLRKLNQSQSGPKRIATKTPEKQNPVSFQDNLDEQMDGNSNPKRQVPFRINEREYNQTEQHQSRGQHVLPQSAQSQPAQIKQARTKLQKRSPVQNLSIQNRHKQPDKSALNEEDLRLLQSMLDGDDDPVVRNEAGKALSASNHSLISASKQNFSFQSQAEKDLYDALKRRTKAMRNKADAV